MIQVEEVGGLGCGQIIETMMAQEVGLKVFRTYTNEGKLWFNGVAKLSEAVKAWYKSGCKNSDLENVFIGDTDEPYAERPKHEKL